MSGARSPRPRPAGAVMPTPLGTPPLVRSIANESDPPQCSDLRHRQLSPRRSATWMECSWPRPHRPLRRPRQGAGVRSGSAGRLVVSASRSWTASSAPDLHDARRPGSHVIRHRRPALCLVELRGFEPLTPCMPSRNPGRSSTTKPCVASHRTEAVIVTHGASHGLVRLEMLPRCCPPNDREHAPVPGPRRRRPLPCEPSAPRSLPRPSAPRRTM
jgi:hypothetical protein